MLETWLAFIGLVLVGLWSRRQDSSGASVTRPDAPKSSGTDIEGAIFRSIPYAKGPLSRSELERLAVKQAQESGATPAVLLAVCDIETANWDQRATNLAGGDGARGGAWGCPQITLQTARTLDDRDPTAWRDIDPLRGGEALLDYPELALELAAAVVAEAEERARGRNGTLQDVASYYNSGRNYDAAPTTTRNNYVPKFLAAYAKRAAGRWS